MKTVMLMLALLASLAAGACSKQSASQWFYVSDMYYVPDL